MTMGMIGVSLSPMCKALISVLVNQQAWNFIFERARLIEFLKGHFHWKLVVKVYRKLFEGTKTSATKTMAPVNVQACFSSVQLNLLFPILVSFKL